MKTIQSILLTVLGLLGASSVPSAVAQTDWSAYSGRLTSPVNGTAITSPTVTFQWSAGYYVESYFLALGSSPGSRDAGSFQGTATYYTAAQIPLNGQPLYATLYCYIGGAWQRGFYSVYSRGNSQTLTAAQMIAPQNGTILTGANMAFQWDAGVGASAYYLYVGNQAGQQDIFGGPMGLNRSWTVTLPQDGRAIFVRLYTQLGGGWSYRDYQYRTAVQGTTGTGMGNTSSGGTVLDRMLRFDGANDYVRVPAQVSHTSYTVHIWFRTTDPDCGLYTTVSEFEDGYDRTIGLRQGNVTCRVWSDERIESSGKNYADGKWHRVAHVYGGNEGGQKLYLDGVLVASGKKAASDFNWQHHLRIGHSPDAGHPFFKGDIFSVALYNVALSATDIAKLDASNRDYPNLIGYWTFDEAPSSQDIVNSARFGSSAQGTLGSDSNVRDDDPKRVLTTE